jgi:hypothetical protein
VHAYCHELDQRIHLWILVTFLQNRNLTPKHQCPFYLLHNSLIKLPLPWAEMMGGLQTHSGICGDKKSVPAGHRTPIPWTFSPQPSHYSDWATEPWTWRVFIPSRNGNLSQIWRQSNPQRITFIYMQRDYLRSCHKSFSRSSRRDTPRVIFSHSCSDLQRSRQAHKPTNHKQIPPWSQQMPKMTRIVTHAFVAPP